MTQEKSNKLAWAVLALTPSGRSEVIKITSCDDADQTIKNNPSLYYKSGPFLLAWEPALTVPPRAGEHWSARICWIQPEHDSSNHVLRRLDVQRGHRCICSGLSRHRQGRGIRKRHEACSQQPCDQRACSGNSWTKNQHYSQWTTILKTKQGSTMYRLMSGSKGLHGQLLHPLLQKHVNHRMKFIGV